MARSEWPDDVDPAAITATQKRFGSLCAIGRSLAGFEDVAKTVGAVLAEAQRILPLRSAVVIELDALHPTTSLWHDAAVTPARQAELSEHARAGLEALAGVADDAAEHEPIASSTTVLGRRSSDRPFAEDASAPVHFVLLPLVAPAFAIIGAVQFEFVGENLDEQDLACAGAIVNQLAVALEVHRTRSRLAALTAQIHHSQKAKAVATLVGGVAHYFNNLMTVILGHTEMLLADRGSVEETRESLMEVRDAGERVVALTGQLLAIGRQQRLLTRKVDLNALIDAMRARLLEIVRGSERSLSFELSPGPLHVDADPSQIEVVLAALVLNAHEAISGAGSIVIRTARKRISRGGHAERGDSRPGEYATVSVTDDGRGIDVASHARMFEPFFSTKDPGTVAGLGLAVVDGIVDQSGGFIDVTSEASRGTTVVVSLPALPRDVAERKTILVVDADPATRELILSSLPAPEFTCIAAPDWETAVDACVQLKGQIDMIVLGTAPLGEDVAVRIHRLRLLRPAVRVVVISSQPETITLPKGGRTTGLAILGRSFAAAELLAAVRSVLSDAC